MNEVIRNEKGFEFWGVVSANDGFLVHDSHLRPYIYFSRDYAEMCADILNSTSVVRYMVFKAEIRRIAEGESHD